MSLDGITPSLERSRYKDRDKCRHWEGAWPKRERIFGVDVDTCQTNHSILRVVDVISHVDDTTLADVRLNRFQYQMIYDCTDDMKEERSNQSSEICCPLTRSPPKLLSGGVDDAKDTMMHWRSAYKLSTQMMIESLQTVTEYGSDVKKNEARKRERWARSKGNGGWRDSMIHRSKGMWWAEHVSCSG
jgi:hypothetical protein